MLAQRIVRLPVPLHSFGEFGAGQAMTLEVVAELPLRDAEVDPAHRADRVALLSCLHHRLLLHGQSGDKRSARTRIGPALGKTES